MIRHLSELARSLMPCKVEHRLEPDDYAKALYLATHWASRIDQMPYHSRDHNRIYVVRETVKMVLARHGTQGVELAFKRTVRDVEDWEAREPNERHHEMHVKHWQWCREKVRHAFRKPKPRTRKVETVPLIDVVH
ncbi:hypothetical protein FHR83_007085 [Actinoplanes campanulatus]|uniref:Uncharacterized protein n=1 Tax=Actinoplanes campanulatus TaxID=113559 RepID=A0A7W5AP17_9ACTN|nr:hypothetical protein [Actinoplanes campanulatus]MBB3099379.1 hypothetical protein [Actinoplanes campanulatus]GGN40222.1 hypothetical protein GCM10010109_69070 [Actinoplanes campanulatus]GID42412.1 hypothetical protein Aca09nite_89180 [Actinoplanes campanulatus]